MHTSADRSLRVRRVMTILLLAVAVAAALALSATLRPETISAGAPTLTDDTALSSMGLAPADPEEAIPAEQAIEAAAAQYQLADLKAEVDTFLYSVTDPASVGTADPMVERPVWIVRITGISLPAPAPLSADGEDTKPINVTRGYIFVDAKSGEWIGTLWTE